MKVKYFYLVAVVVFIIGTVFFVFNKEKMQVDLREKYVDEINRYYQLGDLQSKREPFALKGMGELNPYDSIMKYVSRIVEFSSDSGDSSDLDFDYRKFVETIKVSADVRAENDVAVIEAFVESTYFYNQLLVGFVFEKKGDLDQAIIHYKKALEISKGEAFDLGVVIAEYFISNNKSVFVEEIIEKHSYFHLSAGESVDGVSYSVEDSNDRIEILNYIIRNPYLFL